MANELWSFIRAWGQRRQRRRAVRLRAAEFERWRREKVTATVHVTFVDGSVSEYRFVGPRCQYSQVINQIDTWTYISAEQKARNWINDVAALDRGGSVFSPRSQVVRFEIVKDGE